MAAFKPSLESQGIKTRLCKCHLFNVINRQSFPPGNLSLRKKGNNLLCDIVLLKKDLFIIPSRRNSFLLFETTL